jgi:hypothetical protein
MMMMLLLLMLLLLNVMLLMLLMLLLLMTTMTTMLHVAAACGSADVSCCKSALRCGGRLWAQDVGYDSGCVPAETAREKGLLLHTEVVASALLHFLLVVQRSSPSPAVFTSPSLVCNRARAHRSQLPAACLTINSVHGEASSARPSRRATWNGPCASATVRLRRACS